MLVSSSSSGNELRVKHLQFDNMGPGFNTQAATKKGKTADLQVAALCVEYTRNMVAVWSTQGSLINNNDPGAAYSWSGARIHQDCPWQTCLSLAIKTSFPVLLVHLHFSCPLLSFSSQPSPCFLSISTFLSWCPPPTPPPPLVLFLLPAY